MNRLAITLAALLLGLLANATVLNWSAYDLTFEVPDGGFVTYNSNTRFEIQWDEMVITIQLYKKDKTKDKEIRSNLQRKALAYSMYDLNQGKMKVTGFKTFYTDGTMPDGTRAIIADLISNKQDLIVEVTIVYLYGNREMVDDIIKSFAQNKNKQPNREPHKQRVQPRPDTKPQPEPKPKTKPDERLYDA